MTSKQYEELCRYFLADQLKLPLDQVRTLDLVGFRRPGVPDYDHQIDLYWETANPVVKYVHIANAKWRTPPGKLDQEDVLLIQKIRDKVGAHKAVLITNHGFTDGAQAVAHDEGVALHLVRPQFNPAALGDGTPIEIRNQLQQLVRLAGRQPLYAHEVIRKSFGLTTTPMPSSASSSGPAAAPARTPWYLTKTIALGGRGPTTPGPEGGSAGGQSPGPGGGFGYRTK